MLFRYRLAPYMIENVTKRGYQQPTPIQMQAIPLMIHVSIPEFLKTGLAKIRAHSTTWQLKAIKSVQRLIKKPISDAEQ